MRRLIAGMTLLLAIALVSGAWGAFSERVVTAEGEGESKDEALSRAMRSAVEKGVGVMVDSETMVEKNQLISDKVYTEVKGYINSYEVIEESGDEGLFSVKIKASVSLQKLRKDLKGLKIILAEKENPRAVVSINEYIDGAQLPAPVMGAIFEKSLRKYKIEVIERSQLEKIKKREAAMNYDDPMAAAAIGRQFGAELLILGDGSAELGDVLKSYAGVTAYTYTGSVSIKAVVADTGEVIYSGSAEASETGGGGTEGKTQIARKALKNAAKKISDKAVREVLEKWRSEVYNVARIRITAVSPDQVELDKFKAELEKIDGVDQVSERESFAGVSIYDVMVQAAIKKDFANRIVKIEGVTIKSKTASTLRIDIQ
jgi:hypothetical protein